MKLINEMEIRYRKEEPPSAKYKRTVKAEMQYRSRKLVTFVARSEVVIAGVFHVLDEDNTGEFDPFFVDRMKSALQMMNDKHFI